ncbi:hypothetical protein Cantr_01121 [Candida viswanathii]|uniref:Uncharacterized protein n=1 Tax=Candida viswanathii TaxID=5486 RepID=A0A367YII2_9ASCO|nr:hypothetical protein Cantr_01121 [Candida viswanathii]
MSARQVLVQLSKKLAATSNTNTPVDPIPLPEFIQLYHSILATLSKHGLPDADDAKQHQQEHPIDLISPILNYNASTDQSGLIPFLAKIVWNYIHHPYLNIRVLLTHTDKISQFPSVNLPQKKLSYVEYYFIMSSTKQDDLTNYISYVSHTCQLIKQYKTMVSGWSNDLTDLNNLLEITNYDSQTLLKELLHHVNPEILEYVIVMRDTVAANYIKRMVLVEHQGQDPPTLQNCLKFVLQVLDHAESNKLTPNVCLKLQACLDVIQKSDKFDIITNFNKLTPKLSFCMALNYLNFSISKQIMKNFFMDKFPSCITNHFLVLRLPPLSKPTEFIQFEPKDSLDKVLHRIEEHDTYKTLLMIQHRILSVIKTHMEDEGKTIETVNTQVATSDLLTEKIILSFVEAFVVSLLSPLIVCNKFDLPSIKQHQSNLIYECFNKLLNMSYKSVKSNKIWITLINTVNDICYADLRYIGLFINLFQFQLNTNHDAIISDELISSGLRFFIETFKPDHKWFSEISEDVNEYEITLDDFKFLYPELLSYRQILNLN